MKVCIDVQYNMDNAGIGAVVFNEWHDESPKEIFSMTKNGIDGYESGKFYKRELPCIIDILKTVNDKYSIDTVIIDGNVYLSDNLKPGLGFHLYQELNDKTTVIGVAKNRFKELNNCVKVFRGESKKPLYVTSIGLDYENAASRIKEMSGDFRIPSLVKLADRVARDCILNKL